MKLINLKTKISESLDVSAQSTYVLLQKVSEKLGRSGYAIFALLITGLFYLPALKNGSANAGFIFTGDVLGWYLPALAKTHSLLHSLNFTAIDYSTFNGSSDFFLSPNFFPYHPLVVLYCLVVDPKTTGILQLGHFFVLLMAFHSFVACYFSIKLFTRFFEFEFLEAALIAVVFAFSMHMVNSLGQPPFLLCAAIFPWAAYASLSYAETPNFRNLVYACLPIMFGLLCGYMPMAVACLGLSITLVAAKLLYLGASDVPFDKRMRSLLVATFPYFSALLVLAPYIYAIFDFHKETLSSGFASLFYSAHEYAQRPQSFLTIFSSHFQVPKHESEYSILWGFIAISIAALFFLATSTVGTLTERERKLFGISSTIYVATVLAGFGNYSVISDLVYYLVPQVGKMHVYQRFLLPAELLFAIVFTLMLKVVITERPVVATRIVLALLALSTILVAFLVGFAPDLAAKIGLNNYIVLELFLSFLFVCVLLVSSRRLIYGAAILLYCLPMLNRMYDYSLFEASLEGQKKNHVFVLDEKIKQKVLSYFSEHSKKAVVKYVDITPMWRTGTVTALYATAGVETFPKVFPYYALEQQRLSTYGGFTFYLSARGDYMRKMPVVGNDVAQSPDWEYLKNTGADFLVARETDLNNSFLESIVASLKPDDVLRLPNDVVILPLDTKFKTDDLPETLFDNGYLKITPPIDAEERSLVNVAQGKPARQSSDAGADAGRAVDGNTNGNFSLGSVSHTLRDGNAWLEVDLGKSEPIDNVKVWNRTDCCGYCLRNYWLFISNKPYRSEDTAADLRMRPGTWSKQNFMPNPVGKIDTRGALGRYIRIQLPGPAETIKECFLSIAEIQVFRSGHQLSDIGDKRPRVIPEVKIRDFVSNHANDLRLDFETSAPAVVQYQFWDNPRLTYYLNGRRIDPIKNEGIRSIQVNAGHNTIEIRYWHWALTIFWVLYAIYALTFIWAVMPSRAVAYISFKLRKLRQTMKMP